MSNPYEDNDVPQTQRLPRRDLREKAFRRYENYIAAVVQHGRLVVKPWDFPSSETRQMKSANTFICRFQDACTGYKRYQYPSTLIPKNFDVSNLKTCELLDGSVLIENLQFTAEAVRPILSNDHDAILALATKIKTGQITSKASIPIRMVDDSHSEDLAFIDALQAAESPFYGHFVTKPQVENGILWVLMD